MSTMRKHNVTTFPRPPIVERTNRHIQIKWHGQLLADCPPGEGYWVLEAHHAPGALPSTIIILHPASPDCLLPPSSPAGASYLSTTAPHLPAILPRLVPSRRSRQCG